MGKLIWPQIGVKQNRSHRAGLSIGNMAAQDAMANGETEKSPKILWIARKPVPCDTLAPPHKP